MSNITEIGTDKRPVPAIYVRVSTEEQAQSGTSLDSQLEALRKEIETARLPKPLEFVDDGYSGVAANRPGLMELEQAIAEGKVSEVRIAALDRLARDLVLQETLLNRWLREGVRFSSIREPDLGKTDPTRVLVRQVLGAISQYEREVIAARMLAGRIARAHQGFWPGGKIGYGLTLEGVPPRPVLDEEKAAVIRDVGLRVIKGEKAARIADELNRSGVEGPSGKGWEGGYLSRMLKNPLYRGEGRYRVREFIEPHTRRKTEHALRATKNRAKMRPPEDWISIEVPAVLSQEEWALLQAALAQRATTKRQPADYLLSRRFFTPCGSRYQGNYNAGKPRYLCQHRRKRKVLGTEDCGCPQVSAPLADQAVWTSLVSVLSEPERLLATAREELNRRGIAQSESRLKKEFESVERRLAKVRQSLERLTLYHAERDTLDDATFESSARSLREEIQRLEAERNQLSSALSEHSWTSEKQSLDQIAKEIIERLDELSFEERNRVLALLDVRICINETGRLKGWLAVPISSNDGTAKVRQSTFSRFRRRTFVQ